MKRNRDLPLPLRLTIIYALLVIATLTFVIGLTLRLVHLYLARELDMRLLATVTEFREGPARYVSHSSDLDREASTWLADHAFASDEVVAIRTVSGLVLTTTGGLDLRQVSGARDLVEADATVWRTLSGPNGRVRSLAVPLVLDGRQVGTMVVASSKARLSATMRALATGIVGAGALGLLLAVVAGYGGVRRSLRPLVGMLAQIEAIQATGDLSHRLGHAGPRDEVGRMAEAFDRMLVRLENAFTSQRRFVADASHELRTPLAVARRHLELLRHEMDEAKLQRSAAVATEELDRMSRIVNDLLLLARLDEGMPLSRALVEVELVVREALLRSMQLMPRRTLVDVEPGLEVLADTDGILQVLTNLLTNAAVHGGDNATITVEARGSRERVVISVADTGPGIPPEDLPYVFDRFYRGTRARRTPGGVGLGLPIAATLVRAMGGEIRVQSRPGEGAVFWIDLPRPRTARYESTVSPRPAEPRPRAT